MNRFTLCFCLVLLGFVRLGGAADSPTPETASVAPVSAVKTELLGIIKRIQEKAQAGQTTEAALAAEISALDAMLAAHKAEQTDDVAQVLVIKAGLYFQIIGDLEKSATLFRQLRADFPASTQAREVDNALKGIALQQEADRIQKTITAGAPFPDFTATDTQGQTLSVGKFKGNVVLLDFWATWCPPCLEGMKQNIFLHNKYQPRGLQIIGINMDIDRANFDSVVSVQKIGWPQYHDGRFWDTTLAQQYGVMQLPANILIDAEGRIVGKNLFGPALQEAVAKLLGP